MTVGSFVGVDVAGERVSVGSIVGVDVAPSLAGEEVSNRPYTPRKRRKTKLADNDDSGFHDDNYNNISERYQIQTLIFLTGN